MISDRPTLSDIVSLIDLTRLEDDDGDEAIESLCRRARTPFGRVAAVCVYPRFLPTARRVLAEEGLEGRVALATVVNFPDGTDETDRVVAELRRAVVDGADEIDVVFPWRELLDGQPMRGRDLVRECRRAAGDKTLKMILETGELGSPGLIAEAAEIALVEGADFLKTSTGKVPVNATPEAARILLETIRDSGRDAGCKVSGGIRTADQALEYLELAAEVMGERWIEPRHFRIGASGLLDDLLERLRDEPEA
jgi:deoxyribose-phosphate aldolase